MRGSCPAAWEVITQRLSQPWRPGTAGHGGKPASAGATHALAVDRHPPSVHDALRSLRYSMQTGQVRQQRGHEDQTLMFSNDSGTQHARHVEAQQSVAVQIKRFPLPPSQVHPDDLDGIPVDQIRHQNGKGTRQLRLGKVPHKAHHAQAQDADPQRESPIGVPSEAAPTTR
jgi:hypothetical protein